MHTNLHQIRRPLLIGTLLWLAMAVMLTPDTLVVTAALIVAVAALLLYRLIAPNGERATLPAAILALVCFMAAATSALLILDQLALLTGWSWPLAVAASWGITLAGTLWAYNRLILVPSGMLHVYTGPIRTRTIHGYAKIPRPNPLFEHLQAVVPTRLLKLDLEITEIGTRHGSRPGRAPRHIVDTGPPASEQQTGIWNIYCLELAIELSLSPERWRTVNSIPCDELIHQLRTEYGGRGRNSWHEPRYWIGLAKGYIGEIAEELTRELVQDTGWSALSVRQRKNELAHMIRERLAPAADAYGIIIHTVDIVQVAVDEPVALRRTRDLELMGEAWQRQQGLVLETFQASLQRLGLQLTAAEVEHLTRVHLWDLVSHLQHYGHLDFIVSDLFGGMGFPAGRGHPDGGRPPSRRVA